MHTIATPCVSNVPIAVRVVTSCGTTLVASYFPAQNSSVSTTISLARVGEICTSIDHLGNKGIETGHRTQQ